MIFEQGLVGHLLHERVEVEASVVDARPVVPESRFHEAIDRVRVRGQVVVLVVASHGVEPFTVDFFKFGRKATELASSSSLFFIYLKRWDWNLERLLTEG